MVPFRKEQEHTTMTDHTTAPNTVPEWLDGYADQLDPGEVSQLARQRAWFTDRGMPAAEADTMTEGMVGDLLATARVQQAHAHLPEPWWAGAARTDGWMGRADGSTERTWLLWHHGTDTEPGDGQVHVEVIGEQAGDGSTRVQVQVHVDTVPSGPGALTPDTARALAAKLVQAAEHTETLARQDDGAGTI